jgi:hypothetical protein
MKTIVVENEDMTDIKKATMIEDSLSNHFRQNARDLVSLHRPHPQTTAGIPLEITFVSPTFTTPASFEYTLQPNFECIGPTEIHVPIKNFPLPPETKVNVNFGRWEVSKVTGHDWILSWWIDEDIKEAEPKLRLEGISCQQ